LAVNVAERDNAGQLANNWLGDSISSSKSVNTACCFPHPPIELRYFPGWEDWHQCHSALHWWL
jgi:hypothetical protein